MQYKPKRKCYSFKCDRYPKCDNAAGSCCAVDLDDDEMVIKPEECYDKGNYELFVPKK